jgi:hypothetical protein
MLDQSGLQSSRIDGVATILCAELKLLQDKNIYLPQMDADEHR